MLIAHAKKNRKFFLVRLASRVSAPYLTNFSVGQLRGSVRLTANDPFRHTARPMFIATHEPATTFSHHVSNVVSVSPCEQMRQVATRGVVTLVQDPLVVCQGTVSQRP
jgi:hypothetical protein